MLDPEGPEDAKAMLAALAHLHPVDVQLFLTAVGAQLGCPSCGKDQWSIILPQELGLTNVPLHEIEPDRVGGQIGGLPTVSMMCETCGFMRQHSAFFIGRWLVNQEP